MLRLCVIGGTDEELRDVARRLRGATLDPTAPLAECNAVVLLTAEDGAVERLLDAGKHVLLADLAGLTDERLSWSARTTPRLAVLDRDRYLPSRLLLRQQLAHLGAPGLVRLHRWADALTPVDLLRDLGLVFSLMGGPPLVAHALQSQGALQAHLGFANGGMALLAHAAGPAFADGYSSLSVVGASGAAYADDHANRQLHFTAGAAHALRTDEGARALAAMVQAFVDALATGTDLSPGLTTWRQTLAIRAALSASLATGRAFHWEGLNVSAPRYRCAVLSALKHDYVARGMVTHPRFDLAVVADDADVPAWAHERNQQLADAFRIPYVRDITAALRDHDVQVAIVSPEAERHCDLSIAAVRAGKHVVQDKPLATRRLDADRLLAEVEEAGVRFLMWDRNFVPAVQHAHQQVTAGAVGRVLAVHIDFYFAKDAGPPLGLRQPGYPPLDWYAHQIAAHVDGSDGGLGRTPMGELAIEAIYPLGYLHLLTGGAPVRRVFARSTAHFHQLYADNEVEDLATLSLEMDGMIGSVAVGRIGAASHPSGGEIKLHIIGTTGALVIDESAPAVTVCYRGQPAKEPRRKRVGNDNDFGLADNFAAAIEQGTDTALGIRASHAIYATLEAAPQSCRQGQVVAVS